MEAIRLRGKDVEFTRSEILVLEGNCFKDRVTLLPASLAEPLTGQMEMAKLLHRQDLAEGIGAVYLPGVPAFFPRPEISRRRARMGVAVPVYLGQSVRGFALGCDAATRKASRA